MKFNFKNAIVIVLLIGPTWVGLQTLGRFMFWETTEGNELEFIRIGRSVSAATDYFSAEYEVDGIKYRVKSDVRVSAGGNLRQKLRKWKTVDVLYNPDNPSESAIKYRNGQLYKLMLIWAVCGIFLFFVWRVGRDPNWPKKY